VQFYCNGCFGVINDGRMDNVPPDGAHWRLNSI